MHSIRFITQLRLCRVGIWARHFCVVASIPRRYVSIPAIDCISLRFWPYIVTDRTMWVRSRHRRAEGVQKMSQSADLIGGRDRLVQAMAALAHAALPMESCVIHSHMKWLVREAVAALSDSRSIVAVSG